MWPWSRRIRSARACTWSGVEVVDGDGDAGAAELGDELGGLLDRLGAVVVGPRRAGPAAAAGAHDRRAGFAQGGRDAPPGASGRARDDGHATTQRVSIR